VAAVQLGMLVAASFLFRSAIGALTDAQVGRAMQAFVLLDPQLGAFAHYLWPEIPFLLLFAVVFWCVVYGARPWSWIGAGVALGAALLTKSVIEPFAPVFALGAASGFGWRRGSLRTIGIIGLALLVAMPVIVGNHRRHGIWTIADSSRFNLWLGLNAVGRRSAVGRTAGDEYRAYLESGSTFLERQAALGRRIAAFVQARGPGNLLRHQLSTQYFRLLDKDSMLTEQLAGGAYRRANLGYTARSGWLSSGLRALSYGVYGLALAAAGPGFVLAWRTRSVWLRVLCCWLAYGLLLFLVLEARSRFRIVFLPSIYAAASCALIHRRRLAFVSPVDRLIGVSLAVGALWFAFGGSLLPLEVR
jgi:4-amino-4-deoxy-L-arabinose transferase-like glycosyltransferase